jgi:SAM-dependent methyltransferase
VAVTIDRAAWLRERRAAVEADYDRDAPTYDLDPYPIEVHRTFVDRLVATCPPGGLVLDAPCGTGPYFEQVAASGRRVVGADQSAGMAEQARARGIADRVDHVGLQELAFEAAFDGAMTIDAMEHVPPEDWPAVVANVRRALIPGGHWYVTLEEVEEPTVEEAFRNLQARGVSAVRGEVVEGDTGGYHFYPGRDRALGWLGDAGFDVVAEDADWRDDWGYRHLLLRAGS